MAKRPRDYQNKSSPLTRDYTGLGQFKIQEVRSDIQLKKLHASIAKSDRQIKKHREALARNPSQAITRSLAIKLKHAEDAYLSKLFKLQTALKKVKTDEKAQVTKKENLKAEMSVYITNLEKRTYSDEQKRKARVSAPVGRTPEEIAMLASLAKKPQVKRVGKTIKQVRPKRFGRK